MFPVLPSNPTTVGPEYCNITEEQDKDFKIAFINIIEVFNERWIYKKKNKQWKEINKTVQVLEVEIE